MRDTIHAWRRARSAFKTTRRTAQLEVMSGARGLMAFRGLSEDKGRSAERPLSTDCGEQERLGTRVGVA
ncbi:hypothetical protein E2C01_015478 [Portunus trituberculatus]|uniref:Uncharacterized protein n=1 Tax=Portunus trituberculatus TaxID=210409 RepID=A0A5B7DN37_PORTR|nr:hypothetical protein [Portunus trituberculatus]